ncbi:DUF1203 domain-containing protein [Saccharopolyspora pogona]|uniref:DUF1203 domain-containing protein n=1 Tax=Saccharopolyspora pogona TaxID=333966 RepID=UPI0021E040DD|nr:DUF1203 domain-containing protein [Saccharopolyspora pogona]
MAFQVLPIDPTVLDELRKLGDAGREPSTYIEDDEYGQPLRCCRPGERISLASYAPLRRWGRDSGIDPGAYEEVGPVFIHAETCDGSASSEWPEPLRGRRHVLLHSYSGTAGSSAASCSTATPSCPSARPAIS